MSTVEAPAQRDLANEGLKREVGLLGLMWASEGSIIGSGWLFGALYATIIAGPAALLAWIIASVIVILLALVHAELGGIFPVTGGTSRFPHYAFGSFAGATFGWFAYLQAASVAPIEVLATIQYMSSAEWAKGFLKANGTLSGTGIGVAVGLMLFFVLVNVIGIRWLANVNNGLTTWKVLIPILAIVVFLLFKFHGGNFTAGGGFFVHSGGGPAKTILEAIPGGGIVFALLGFEQAVQLGGESANPQRDLPRAVIGSILIGVVIYVLVQFAFIGALDPATIAHYHSWANLGSDLTLYASPYYTVATVAGLTWLAWILRIDAVVSPGGTGLIYLTSASRLSFGLSKNGYIPAAFEKSSPRTKVPVFGIIVSTIVGLLFLLPFPAWGKLVGVVTGASVLMYAGAPLALGALRLSKPNLPRSYLLPWDKVLAPLAFVTANWIVFWAGWQTYSTLMVAMVVGYILMAVSIGMKLNPNAPKVDWGAAKWMLPYLIGMGLISYFGSFGPGGIIGGVGPFAKTLVGGDGRLPLWWDLITLTVFSLAIYFLAMANRLPEAQVDRYVHEVFPPSTEPGD
ncbi:MAG: APC family permease [Acidimicrobiales bacterium]